jgi:chloride channel 6
MSLCRIMEAILVAAVTSTVSFSAAMLLGECRAMPSSQVLPFHLSLFYICHRPSYTASRSFYILSNDLQCIHRKQENGTTSLIDESVRTYFCPDGQYNDMATLFFNSQEEAIKQLFHQEGIYHKTLTYKEFSYTI